jgi:hypothetical protein
MASSLLPEEIGTLLVDDRLDAAAQSALDDAGVVVERV